MLCLCSIVLNEEACRYIYVCEKMIIFIFTQSKLKITHNDVARRGT